METSRVRVLIWGCSSFTTASILNVLDGTRLFDVAACVRNWDELVDTTYRLVPAVIVFDLDYDQGEQLTVLRDFKNEFPRVPVLALALEGDQLGIDQVLLAGADGICLKSTIAERLADAVVALASGAAWLDTNVAQISMEANCPVSKIKDAFDGGKLAHMELTSKEQQILQLVMSGLSKHQIGDKMSMSIDEVLANERRIMQKLDVPDAVERRRSDIERK